MMTFMCCRSSLFSYVVKVLGLLRKNFKKKEVIPAGTTCI